MSSAPKKTILSVDDSLTIRKLIENALKPAGYEVLLAANGEEGLQLAREARPDLILLDYVLPDVRGVEFCQRLIAEETTRATPVLLISGHGSAIQELYRDCANVVDYLTKPFAANVLQAVVANVLARPEKQVPAPAPAPIAIAAENKPAPAPASPNGVAAAVPRTAVASPTPTAVAELRQRVFEKLVARLHAPLPSIPAWEAARGEQEPFSYYLSRLLPVDLIGEVAKEIVEAGQRVVPLGNLGSTASAGGGTLGKSEPALRGSTRFVSERHVMNFLCHDAAHGELRFMLPEEMVSVFFDQGAIVGISSNHPRFYCAGSAFPFLQVPHAVVSAAMLAQRDSGVPFFITVHAQGSAPGVDLAELLRECGHRCLERLYNSPDVAFSFTPLAELPVFAREHRVEYSLAQLLLESYRQVNDWQHIQEAVPRLELFVGRTAYDAAYLSQLRLNALEMAVLEQIDFRRNVAQLQEALNQPIFEVCRALYCLSRLDLCYLSDLPLIDEEALAAEAAAVALPVPEGTAADSSPVEADAVAMA